MGKIKPIPNMKVIIDGEEYLVPDVSIDITHREYDYVCTNIDLGEFIQENIMKAGDFE